MHAHRTQFVSLPSTALSYVLLAGPVAVFLGGLWLLRQASRQGQGFDFLAVFGGLVLCLGALHAFALFALRQLGVPALEPLAGREHIVRGAQTRQLAGYYGAFVLLWLLHATVGGDANSVYPVLLAGTGMVAVTLTAHVHAHQ